MKAICTICSEVKVKDGESLPAWRRFESKRILEVRNVAKFSYSPFYLLSGKFGLIPEDEEVGFYDHMLIDHESPNLAKLLKLQLKENNITELHFYARPEDEKWKPYYDAIESAAKELKVPYFIHQV
jgi:hypothetical protein